MSRIIFLDIDGPMIPSGMFFVDPHASWVRTFSPICVAILKELVTKADAMIVTNSTHNYLDRPVNIDTPEQGHVSLRQDLLNAGFKDVDLHNNWRTLYPHGGKFSGQINRMDAINAWLAENGEHDWIAFDDCDFTKDERLILIDFDTGITPLHYNRACQIWGLPGAIIL